MGLVLKDSFLHNDIRKKNKRLMSFLNKNEFAKEWVEIVNHITEMVRFGDLVL